MKNTEIFVKSNKFPLILIEICWSKKKEKRKRNDNLIRNHNLIVDGIETEEGIELRWRGLWKLRKRKKNDDDDDDIDEEKTHNMVFVLNSITFFGWSIAFAVAVQYSKHN